MVSSAQRQHLLDRGRVAERGHRPGDAERRVAHVGLHRLGPQVVRGRGRAAVRRRGAGRWPRASARAPARPARPPRRRRPSPGRRGRADRGGRSDPARPGSCAWCAGVSQRRMVRSRPPVKASASSTTTIFWWWEALNGMRIVELERQPGVGLPGEAIGGQGFALEREEDGEVPGERVDAQARSAGEDVVQERQQRQRRLRGAGVQTHAAVDVPADDEDAAARPADGVAEGSEIGVGVDQESGPRRPGDAPAVFSFPEHAAQLNHRVGNPRRVQIRAPAGVEFRSWIAPQRFDMGVWWSGDRPRCAIGMTPARSSCSASRCRWERQSP